MQKKDIFPGVSTATYFDRLPTPEVLRDLSKHGIDNAEVFLNSFSEYEDDFILPLAESVRETGIQVRSIHPMGTQFEPQLVSSQSSQHTDSFRMFEKVVRACSLLGAERYVMHGMLAISRMTHIFSLDRFLNVLKELQNIAAGYGTEVTLENVSWCVFNSPEAGQRILERTDGSLHFTLDIKQCFRSGYSPEDYLKVIAPYTRNIHLCDFSVNEDGSYKWLLPGQGIFDFETFFEQLRYYGYHGPLTIESYSNSYSSLDEVYKSFEYINNTARRVFENE